jgi:hypothetical protein
VARWIADADRRRQGNNTVLSPEDFENFLPLFIGKPYLSAGSFEASADVGQERTLPSRQFLVKQRCFDVVSEISSRVHRYRRLFGVEAA